MNASARLDVYSKLNFDWIDLNWFLKLILILVKPTFKIQPENLIETDYGKTVQLKCEGIANPNSNITCYRNAQLIDFSKQTSILNLISKL